MASTARIVAGDRRWSARQYAFQGSAFRRASRPGIVAIVKPGLRVLNSSAQESGVDTGASGRARVE